ncbi:MAG: TIGR04282 family arsenosugar biosynthesis glycosyltransferase [Verrucomicrobia bacterium]|nr:TIGR04282 family arsenosugar biosynthesis glycosyltransferase [Verrucomicrobiota bacterium]
MSTGDRLLLFVKRPRPGEVKTRLAADLGPEAAADAYRRLTAAVLRALPREIPLRICFAPDEAQAEVETWLSPSLAQPATYHPQGGGDLGVRLAGAFAAAFEAGAERVVVLGSDCIDLTADLLRGAFAALQEVDAVLGPSPDGGYYLLGLRRPSPRVFAGIAWSTERVAAQTLERLAELGWSHRLLPARTDVDTLAEWREVEPRLSEVSPGPCSHPAAN